MAVKGLTIKLDILLKYEEIRIIISVFRLCDDYVNNNYDSKNR